MPCGVFILSILHYNKFQLCFHVLHRDLTEENINKLKKTVSSFSNAQIEFHKVDLSIFKLAKPFKTNDVYLEEAYINTLSHKYTNKWIISNYIHTAYSKTNKELAA